MTANDCIAALEASLSRAAADSSDFDLNPEIILPEARVLRPAAVLVALRATPRGPELVLTKRAPHLRHHPGQISFPGGRMDDTDIDLTSTALREAHEEIALPPDAVRVLGALPGLETVTGFHVTPILAEITRDFIPDCQISEVTEIFSVPFTQVSDLARFRVERRMWRGMWRNYYTVPCGPYYIWGATARILHGLAGRLHR